MVDVVSRPVSGWRISTKVSNLLLWSARFGLVGTIWLYGNGQGTNCCNGPGPSPITARLVGLPTEKSPYSFGT